MKRIIFILLVLFLSTPGQTLVNQGTPIETIVTLKGYPYKPIISKELDKAILYSSTFCPFVGQPARIRLVLDVVNNYETRDYYNYVATWYVRIDELSTKFRRVDTQEGFWKFSEERKMAAYFLDHTDELIESAKSKVNEYDEYDPEIINTY